MAKRPVFLKEGAFLVAASVAGFALLGAVALLFDNDADLSCKFNAGAFFTLGFFEATFGLCALEAAVGLEGMVVVDAELATDDNSGLETEAVITFLLLVDLKSVLELAFCDAGRRGSVAVRLVGVGDDKVCDQKGWKLETDVL